MAIGTQFGFLLAGLAPSVVSAIGTGRDDWIGVAIFTAAVCALSATAISTARETFRRPTAELGQPDVRSYQLGHPPIAVAGVPQPRHD